ncbi:MAG: tRNA lysidine(34) synthetase TilS [Saprospiraceae bacterium]|nr:tRNA lysidine(34) synthetase TilS [Saprospiraceae bacterium]MDW8229112.1 tRNA lysidine(34) synthetase TilS [Saprospiraceae bacterium]
MTLIEQVESFCQEHALLSEGMRVLVAISGGVDSVVLAHVLRERGQPMALAHVNFQLRGAESDEDERFVRALAESWGLGLYVERFDTRAVAEAAGVSVQVAARRLRYGWFEALCDEHGWERIATAHHLNDSVETALFHLGRGTGLSGMAGIPPRSGRVVRPLLCVTRAAIEAYAREQGLTWREDSSNADLHYTRNAIRHKVLPALEEVFPNFVQAAGNTLRHLRAADANAQYLLRKLLRSGEAEGVFSISQKEIESLPAPTDALFDLLQPYGFTPEQAREMMNSRHSTGSEWHSPAGYRLAVGRGEWLLAKPMAGQDLLRLYADDLMVRLPDGSQMFLTEAPAGSAISDTPESVVVDAAHVRFPLLLRRWRPGDAFQPLGMGGKSQKLQDFFTNQKLSVLDKERVWVLENGDGRILWVVGLRLAEPFRITSTTTQYLKLTWLKR